MDPSTARRDPVLPGQAASRPGRRLAGRVIIVTLLALVALPAYLTISPAWRPAAVRLSCAVLVAVGCVHARRWAQAAVAPRAISPLDAPPVPPPVVELDAGFRRLRDDLIASTRSRRYFDLLLWPRLSALAGPELPPPPPERRGLARRGPSLRVLEGIIAEIERRP
ncbi:MAG: hypothetical protein WEG40_11865 [Candidatus Rokuibacteriota bacterium]